MKIPAHVARRAAVKRKRATDGAEGPRRRPWIWTPNRSLARSPPPLERKSQGDRELTLAIDLTVDTPSEGARVEVVIMPMEPTTLAAKSAHPEAGPSPDEGLSAGEQASGEHPTVVGPSVEEMSSAFGTAPTAPELAEAAEGGKAEAIPSRPSVMNHGRRAKQLISQICLPEIQGELHHQGASVFFQEAFVSHIWVSTPLYKNFFKDFSNCFVLTISLVQSINSLIAMRDVLD